MIGNSETRKVEKKMTLVFANWPLTLGNVSATQSHSNTKRFFSIPLSILQYHQRFKCPSPSPRVNHSTSATRISFILSRSRWDKVQRKAEETHKDQQCPRKKTVLGSWLKKTLQMCFISQTQSMKMEPMRTKAEVTAITSTSSKKYERRWDEADYTGTCGDRDTSTRRSGCSLKGGGYTGALENDPDSLREQATRYRGLETRTIEYNRALLVVTSLVLIRWLENY